MKNESILILEEIMEQATPELFVRHVNSVSNYQITPGTGHSPLSPWLSRLSDGKLDKPCFINAGHYEATLYVDGRRVATMALPPWMEEYQKFFKIFREPHGLFEIEELRATARWLQQPDLVVVASHHHYVFFRFAREDNERLILRVPDDEKYVVFEKRQKYSGTTYPYEFYQRPNRLDWDSSVPVEPVWSEEYDEQGFSLPIYGQCWSHCPLKIYQSLDEIEKGKKSGSRSNLL